MKTLNRIASTEIQHPVHYQHLLVPIDFGTASTEAVEMALRLARRSAADLTFLHVLPRLSSMLAADMDHVSAEMLIKILEDCRADVLQRLQELIPQRDRDRVACTAVDGEPVREIINAAVRLRVDLIVMGSRGRRGLKRFLRRQMVKEVSRRAPCPVLRVEAPSRYELVRV